MHKTLFLLLFLLSPGILFPQTDYTLSYHQKIDSLEKLLPGSLVEKRVDLLNELASCYVPFNFDSSIFYSSQAARLATLFDYSRGTGMARYYAGNAYYYKLDFKNALINYLSAQPIFENGHYYNELGDLHGMLGHMNFLNWRQ